MRLQRFDGRGNPTQTLGFFDVSTPAATLNNNQDTNTAIFDDLGTGQSYGTFDVSTSGSETGILSFTLNATAIADINAAAGGFFSIGGALDAESLSSPGRQNLFGFSNNASGRRSVQQLVINVPEPSSVLGTLAFGVFGAGWVLKHRQKNQKIAGGARSITEASE